MPGPADLLFLAPGLGVGGTERHLARLLPALARRGFAPRVWNAGETGEAQTALERSGIPVYAMRLPDSLRQIRRLAPPAGALARRRPALVHSYLYGRHWIDALLVRLAGVPYVGARRNLAHWREGAVLARERWRDRHSAAIVANSEAVAAVARREGAPPDRLVVIPNGVDLPPANPGARARARAELGLGPAERVIGSVGSLKAIKDPVTLLEAFARLTAAGAADRLVLVGAGPLLTELRDRAVALGCGDRLLLAGARVEPEALLAAFDVFALASRAEGFSNALVEAMAAGLPVVATRVGGNLEAVLAGETGELVPPGEVGEMTRALGALLGDPARAARLGTAARLRVAHRYSAAVMADAHAALYNRLLEPTGAARHAA